MQTDYFKRVPTLLHDYILQKKAQCHKPRKIFMYSIVFLCTFVIIGITLAATETISSNEPIPTVPETEKKTSWDIKTILGATFIVLGLLATIPMIIFNVRSKECDYRNQIRSNLIEANLNDHPKQIKCQETPSP